MPGIIPWGNKDQVVEPARDQSRGEPEDREVAAVMIDDRQGWIAVLIFSRPDIAGGWIDLQPVNVSWNADVLYDRAGCDIVFDNVAGATFAGGINAVAISHPEAAAVGRDCQIVGLRRAGWRRTWKKTKSIR